MTDIRTYQVSDVARITGLTVRTLHHYHAIGLLAPRLRSDAGYRLYTDDDLLRLQQIMIRRQLGLDLESIRLSLDDPNFDLEAALTDQLETLRVQAGELSKLISSVERTLQTFKNEKDGRDMTDKFDGFDPDQYQDEARQRWGETEAYRQSTQRVARMSQAEKKDLARKSDEATQRLAAVFTSGAAPDSTEAMDLAEEARLFIHETFYDCPKQMHVKLADMYVEDPRFTETFDKHAEGLAAWFRRAIIANAER